MSNNGLDFTEEVITRFIREQTTPGHVFFDCRRSGDGTRIHAALNP